MSTTNGHGSRPERVALYLRVSSEEQRGKETIELQEEFLEQYCGLYELEVAGTYKDDGVSGTIPLHERPEGRRLLEDAKEGKFDAVLLYKLDRLGRTLLVIIDAHDRLQEAGVALRSATEPNRHLHPIWQAHLPDARLIRGVRARDHPGEDAGRPAPSVKGRTTLRSRPLRIPLRRARLPPSREEEAAVVREIIANVAGVPHSTRKRSG
jgi:hypothetical protein